MENITVAEIALLLNVMRDSNQPVILFLGSRAGSFFRNDVFYDKVAKFSKSVSKFKYSTTVEKFAESYRILTDQSEGTEYNILRSSLKNSDDIYRREDECLTQLVKEGYFDLIISTNIDDFLEIAFDREKLRENYDYHVFYLGVHLAQEGIRKRFARYCTIVKVYGDIQARKYTLATNEFHLDEDGELKDFLGSNLAKNILIVGFDPVWDQPIERVFPKRTKDSLLYVNEEAPADDSVIAEVIKLRKGLSLIGLEGSYKNFIPALHSELFTPAPKSTKTQKVRRLKVFLCHSSGDKLAVRMLHQRLIASKVDPWLDEENLLPGQDWDFEIRKAVRTSDVVIVCLTHGSTTKTGFVQKEIKFALDVADEQPEGAIFLIPLKLEECTVPQRLSHLHWVNLFEENGFNKLISALQRRAVTLDVIQPLAE